SINIVNEDGLNHNEWTNLPWYQRIFSSDPIYGPSGGSSGALGFVSGPGEVKLIAYLSKALNFSRNAKVVKAGTTVLGHYPEYVKLAEQLAARRFQIPSSIWNSMSSAEQWIANTKFLNRMILRGDNIRVATPLNQVKPGSFFQKELNYLFEKGYKLSSDGLWLIK
ncbi:MAG TPA: hypothetical protein VF677_10655, partial [Flavobacterium sp.]